jgi:tetrapyrrole methylase family protein/MazG family protein
MNSREQAARAGEFDHSFEGLMEVLDRLRAPDGCPWDRGQTRESLRDQFLEEAYELVEALDEGDDDEIVEEVGDVLLHAAYQIQLGKEEGRFSEPDVIGALIAKLVRRHPHVFEAEREDLDALQVLANWDEIKRAEKPHSQRRSAVDGVPRATPSLAGAQAIQGKAQRTGFDWDDVAGVLEKVREEIDELSAATTAEEAEAEFGDLLFSLVNAARWLQIDAEAALRKANRRFAARFRAMEMLARERGDDFRALCAEDKESLWKEVKEGTT